MKLALMSLMGLMVCGCEKPENDPAFMEMKARLEARLQKQDHTISRLKAELAKNDQSEGLLLKADQENYTRIVRMTSRLALAKTYTGSADDDTWFLIHVQHPLRDLLGHQIGVDRADQITADEIRRTIGQIQNETSEEEFRRVSEGLKEPSRANGGNQK